MPPKCFKLINERLLPLINIHICTYTTVKYMHLVKYYNVVMCIYNSSVYTLGNVIQCCQTEFLNKILAYC